MVPVVIQGVWVGTYLACTQARADRQAASSSRRPLPTRRSGLPHPCRSGHNITREAARRPRSSAVGLPGHAIVRDCGRETLALRTPQAFCRLVSPPVVTTPSDGVCRCRVCSYTRQRRRHVTRTYRRTTCRALLPTPRYLRPGVRLGCKADIVVNRVEGILRQILQGLVLAVPRGRQAVRTACGGRLSRSPLDECGH